MAKFISCGQYDKNYICLYIGSLLVYLGSFLSYILAHIYNIGSDTSHQRKINKLVLALLLSYCGQSLSIFLQLIMNKSVENKNNNNLAQNTRKISSVAIKYIFNEESEKATKKDYIHIFGFSLILLIVDLSKSIMTIIYEQNSDEIIYNDLFSTLLFSIFILSICKTKYYKHQKFAIIIILLVRIIPFAFQYNSFNLITLLFYYFKYLFLF